MSPLRRYAMFGVVAAILFLMTAAALAVAHRDARRDGHTTTTESPGYANRPLEPITPPAGMIRADDEAYRYPDELMPSSEQVATNTFDPFDETASGAASLVAPFQAAPLPDSVAPLAASESDIVVSLKADKEEAAPPRFEQATTLDALPALPGSQPPVNALREPGVATAVYQSDSDAEGEVVMTGGLLPPPTALPNSTPPPSGISPPPAAVQLLPPGAAGPPGFSGLSAPPLSAAPSLSPSVPPVQAAVSARAQSSLSAPAQSSLSAPAQLPAAPPAQLPTTLPPLPPGGPAAAKPTAEPAPAAAAAFPASLPANFGASAATAAADADPASISAAAQSVSAPPTGPTASSSAASPFSGPSTTFPQPPSDSDPPSLALPTPTSSTSLTPTTLTSLPTGPVDAEINRAAPPNSVMSDRSPRTTSPSPVDAPQGSGRPGSHDIEGVQQFALTLHKHAPAEVQVGHPAVLTLQVKNDGSKAVDGVVVSDRIPAGTRLQSTTPPAENGPDGSLVWKLGAIPAGGQHTLSVEIIPETEGEIGSVATVSYSAQAGVRTVSTRPVLSVVQSADPEVLIGQPWKVRFQVTNEGTGVAYDVGVEEDVPSIMRHSAGERLGMQIGDLAPGQSRQIELQLEATAAGRAENTIRVTSANAEPVTDALPVEIVSPQIALSIDGPNLRYLERPATYQIAVSNGGTAIARNIEIMAMLPRGMQFISTINNGDYLADKHAVVWSLEELAAGQETSTEMTLLPVAVGSHDIRMEGRSDRATAEATKKTVRVEGQSELAFTIEDDNDPIETGRTTAYLLRLENVGNRIDTNVRVNIELPAGAQLQDVVSPLRYETQGNSVLFDPVEQMKPRDVVEIRFAVSLPSEGLHVTRVAVQSDQRPIAVVKEESTQVYSDR